MLKLYGQEVNLFKLGRMPAQVLIDKAGVTHHIHYGHSMSDIPKNEELLALGDEINAHLRIDLSLLTADRLRGCERAPRRDL